MSHSRSARNDRLVQYRPLGSSGVRVSAVAIGCSGFWGKRAFAEEDAAKVIHEAIERGVTFFDTGHHYCDFNAEPRLGRILRPYLSGGRRESFVLSSKATDANAAKSGSLARLSRRHRRRDYAPDYLETTCLASIRQLGCDYLDIFQLHGIREDEIDEPMLERLASMKRRGLFRLLGVNTHSESLNRFVARHPEVFDMVLIDYNVLQVDREPLIGELNRAGVGVVAGTVLAQGHLIAGKIGRIRSMADLWYLARSVMKPSSRQLARAAGDMREILSSFHGLSAAQAAFAYVLGQPGVASAVFGTTRPGNLIEIVSSLERTMSEQERAAIQAAFASTARRVSA